MKTWKVIVYICSENESNNFVINIKNTNEDKLQQEIKKQVNKKFGSIDYEIISIYEM